MTVALSLKQPKTLAPSLKQPTRKQKPARSRIKNKNQHRGEKNTHFVIEKEVRKILDVCGGERGGWGW